MFTIDRARREVAALPVLARLGLTLMALAGFADVVAHLDAAGHAGHGHAHAAAALQAHLAAFVGMVVVFVGVVVDGVRQQRHRATGSPSKGVA